MEQNDRKPLYPIGVAAELVGADPKTLRFYELHGLISPSRRGGKRFYSNIEILWLGYLVKQGPDIASVKRLLAAGRCWSTRSCPEQRRQSCPGALEMPLPCWEIRQRCSGATGPCSLCEVYVEKIRQAMGRAS